MALDPHFSFLITEFIINKYYSLLKRGSIAYIPLQLIYTPYMCEDKFLEVELLSQKVSSFVILIDIV